MIDILLDDNCGDLLLEASSLNQAAPALPLFVWAGSVKEDLATSFQGS